MASRTVPATPDAIVHAARLLRDGALVSFPTETVYGLGGDATNDAAVARIFAAKGRPHSNPLILHVPGLAEAAPLAIVDERARLAIERFWPGPLTLGAAPAVRQRNIAAGERRPRHAGLAGAGPSGCAGAIAGHRSADRRPVGQPVRPRQPDDGPACRDGFRR